MSRREKPRLSHLDATGQARMVDVADKPITERTAVASARIRSQPGVIDALLAGELPKGDALATARIAAIQAAKRTAELIPLCHPLTIDWIDVSFEYEAPDSIAIRTTVKTTARTGVEMEAITAATVAALTLYDMAKAADKNMEIGPIRLETKTGGKSGTYRRSDG